MVKGYWIVSVDISDPESYKMYVAENRSAVCKYGARFVIRGGKSQVVEGQGRSRIVVIEFKDYATALDAIDHPNIPKQLKFVRVVLWLTSLSLRVITARSQQMGKIQHRRK
jgi:uncharacterized protein (DUF1330 family)